MSTLRRLNCEAGQHRTSVVLHGREALIRLAERGGTVGVSRSLRGGEEAALLLLLPLLFRLLLLLLLGRAELLLLRVRQDSELLVLRDDLSVGQTHRLEVAAEVRRGR